MTITITHTPADGTLVEGTSRGDGTNTVLKANGFRWFRTLGLWGISGSRDRDPNRTKITAAADALRAAGHDVEIDIDDTHRDPATVEADRAARAEDRAAALAVKAERRRDQADAAWDADRKATAALPPGGEPIHVGHHSEARHRNAIDKAHRAMGRAVVAEREAVETARRADVATRATDHRYNPVTVKNRIDGLEAEQRADQRALDGHTRTLFTTGDGTKVLDVTEPAAGKHRDTLTARMTARADDIAYWARIRAEQIAAGEATNYSRDTIAVGDQVCYRRQWYTVRRVNAKTVTIPSIVGGSWTDTIGYHKLTGHRPATTSR
ncbi:DUF3560 domain-containing protein [Williamsia sp. MIQD14]|uniref:DUF3560 domain-containing protein n=1 Tax=Williamsia sp. MIQD14 TaxID=3425703 RepID=UPI003DA06FF8